MRSRVAVPRVGSLAAVCALFLPVTFAEGQESSPSERSSAQDAYERTVVSAIEQNWTPPAGMDGKSCQVRIEQTFAGDVLSISFRECASMSLFESLRQAIMSASPLPLPADATLFQGTFRAKFIVPTRE